MQDELDHKIARLKRIERKELMIEWQVQYGRTPPKHLSRSILIRSIAYKYQENAFGGLSEAARKELDRLSRAYKQNPDRAFNQKTKIKPGTRLIREWKGELHEVIATTTGFEHKNKHYKTLSEVASAIAGTHWSGPRFFGMTLGKPAKVEAP